MSRLCPGPGGREAAIHERFLQIQIAFVVEGLRDTSSRLASLASTRFRVYEVTTSASTAGQRLPRN
jgi:hypothetical protein